MDQSLKFTPGPWKARGTLGPLRAEHLKGPFVIEVAATGQHLTTMNGWRSDQQEVDARLMAAAPDLLETLQEAWHFIEDISEDDPERITKFFALRVKIREVFTKVQGE